ncbi:hypothetical protein N7493_003673 [Penicillium malachiteum]|uniref:Uncharacterized protein n=1 Tax=Penicillium malachiteum TaxID=1324776 RepID=A0AAD6HQN5_9EURO|nr:hypothetical protein N7493_003673 [Penicillium malachiteum]
MCPDINSLPPSRSSSSSSSFPHRNLPSGSPGTAPAPMNPSNTTPISPRPSRGSSAGRLSVSERRRSTAGMNVNPTDSSSVAPGNHGDSSWSDHRSTIGHAFRTASPTSHGGSPVFATADPHHQRAPSLGELHQELEQEQEAQVNRLLQMIRSQQTQLQQLQQQQSSQPGASTAIVDEPSSASERSPSFSLSMPPAVIPGSRLSISSVSNRRSSRPPSQATSPNLQPRDSSRESHGTEAFPTLRDSGSRRGSRDESAYYQAEATMLSRENQMLRQRVRELERQIGDLTTARPSASPANGSGEATGQAGPETVDPPAMRSADGKD